MASTTSQLTVPEAIDIFKQHQGGEIDPAVTAFLWERAREIWERIQAQPLAYVFTREEFAVFNCYRGVFDDPVAQQAVRRFWEQQNESTPQTWKADPGQLGSPGTHGVTTPQEKSELFLETRKKRDQGTISEDSRLTRGEPTPQTPHVLQRHPGIPENLCIDWARLSHTSNGEEYGLLNSIKIWVQSLTRESWDWWPLHPSFRQLRDDEVRIKRYCVS